MSPTKDIKSFCLDYLYCSKDCRYLDERFHTQICKQCAGPDVSIVSVNSESKQGKAICSSGINNTLFLSTLYLLANGKWIREIIKSPETWDRPYQGSEIYKL